jgi:hypothetical protein
MTLQSRASIDGNSLRTHERASFATNLGARRTARAHNRGGLAAAEVL